MNFERYFDNAATTPLDPRVFDAMKPFLLNEVGNPNSVHSPGLFAREAVERARQQIANLIGADDPSQITFTSGATEANNWVLSSSVHSVVSPIEHASLDEIAVQDMLPRGKINGNRWEIPANVPVDVASQMLVNNETGLRLLPPVLASGKWHSDITQALGKLPIEPEFFFASASSHKIYGPKGVGFLYQREPSLEPLLRGGEQETGLRAGTLNVPAIVGFGLACEIAAEEMEANFEAATKCRTAVLEALGSTNDLLVNEGDSPYILSVSFSDVLGEALVLEMDAAGYALSSGAACSSRSTEPSHVLTALGLPLNLIRGTVRISFGKWNTPQDSRDMALKLAQKVATLRTMKS